MTPKEKAEDLFMIYVNNGMSQIKPVINRVIRKEMAKQCALITVDEIIEANKKCSYTIDYVNYLDFKKIDAKVRSEIEIFMFYWNEVKNEINKL